MDSHIMMDEDTPTSSSARFFLDDDPSQVRLCNMTDRELIALQCIQQHQTQQ